MRNELVEELSVDPEAKGKQNRTRSPSESAQLAREKVKQAEEGKECEPAKKQGHEAPAEQRAGPRRRRPSGVRMGLSCRQPERGGKLSGMPNNRIVTCPAVEERALRAARSAHDRRECARCARERIPSAVGGEVVVGGDRLTSRRWRRTSWIQARRWTLRLQSRQSNGAGPTRSGCSSTLTWCGFAVALPFH
jgi:hypothetical protein